MSQSQQHAIVLGASMSGLLNAAVLARHFERVTIIERDALGAHSEARKGVPQGRHVHGFWQRGMQVIEGLLPGVRAELIATGAVAGDAGRDFMWHQFGVTKLRKAVGIPALLATRPHLEATVRQRVAAISNIQLRDNTSVLALIAEGRGQACRVRGVEIEMENKRERLDADLVVDASGRAGLATRWLAELGCEAPAESKVKIDVAYVSRQFKRSERADTIAYLAITTPPEGKRGAVAFAVEGDRWLVSLAGFMGEQPPEDLTDFIEYARSLPVPDVYNIVSRCEPIGEPARFKFPTNLRRHYEKLQHFPAGFLVTGDALTCFNPAYGQGMTVAALEAEALDLELTKPSSSAALYKRFFKRAAKIIDVPWSLTTGEDLRYPEATGHRPFGLSLLNAYVTKLHRAAAHDHVVCRAFFRVASFEALPPSLFAPSIVWRVLRGPNRSAARAPSIDAAPAE